LRYLQPFNLEDVLDLGWCSYEEEHHGSSEEVAANQNKTARPPSAYIGETPSRRQETEEVCPFRVLILVRYGMKHKLPLQHTPPFAPPRPPQQGFPPCKSGEKQRGRAPLPSAAGFDS